MLAAKLRRMGKNRNGKTQVGQNRMLVNTGILTNLTKSIDLEEN